ncbi:hypothetical protein [Actinoplanes palleronii]|uniref:Uncharacterized protein n=1 Tax=Actinoplanes palleronii TaxID=113570 RepID=A0ABQ4B5M7_9ACTN|nr:hypothetical protein [Actinoplanes palleronii]GIE65892.1 hypothetical protein Apa02nite_020000 [Actinoplanes palleronii]
MSTDVSIAPVAAEKPGTHRREKEDGRAATFLAIWLYLGGGVVLTAGLWRDPGGRRVAGNPGDTDNYQWWFGWIAHSLHHLNNPFFTDAMNMPAGVNLMSNTSMPLVALLLSWLTLLAGPLVT